MAFQQGVVIFKNLQYVFDSHKLGIGSDTAPGALATGSMARGSLPLPAPYRWLLSDQNKTVREMAENLQLGFRGVGDLRNVAFSEAAQHGDGGIVANQPIAREDSRQ